MDSESDKPSAEPGAPPSSDDTDREPRDGPAEPEPEAKPPSETTEGSTSSSPPGPKPAKRRKKRKHGTSPPTATADKPAPKAPRYPGWVVILAVAAVVVVVGGAAIFLARRHAGKSQWSVGQEIPVEITLVGADRSNLACAATEQVGGKHCAFETSAKTWSKSPTTDDKATLRPYTTTDRRNFLAAGLWSEPVLAKARFGGRFSVKCVFVVEGVMKQLAVRWASAGPWVESLADWFAGTVKDCALVEPAASPSHSAAVPTK